MTESTVKLATRSGPDGSTVIKAVTAIMGTVVGLTFLFGFGNVLNLALRSGCRSGWRRSSRLRWISPFWGFCSALDRGLRLQPGGGCIDRATDHRQSTIKGSSASQRRHRHRQVPIKEVATL
jgi:hypothetical protein